MSTRFEVKLYYGKDAEPPKVPGQLAIHTWNIGDLSKDMEVDAGRRRRDIGRVEVLADGRWTEVYNEEGGAS